MSLVKGVITPIDPEGDEIVFEYNPSGFEVGKDAHWAEIGIPGLDFPLQQFVRGNLKTLSLEVYLNRDHYDTPFEVRDAILQLENLVEITAQTNAPPVCVFQWGRFDFVCVVGSVGVRYTMFDETGEPIEATVSLTLRRYEEKHVSFQLPRQEIPESLARAPQPPAFQGWRRGSGSVFASPTEGTLTHADTLVSLGQTRTHIAIDGDSFQRMAALHYGEPALWRVIEYANHTDRFIDSLRTIRAGERFLIPDPESALAILEGITNFPPEITESLRFTQRGAARADSLVRSVPQ